MRTRTITTVIGIWSTMTNAFTLCTKWFRTIEFSHSHTSTIRHISVGMLFCRKSWIQWRSHQESPGRQEASLCFRFFLYWGQVVWLMAFAIAVRCRFALFVPVRTFESCLRSLLSRRVYPKSFIYFVKGTIWRHFCLRTDIDDIVTNFSSGRASFTYFDNSIPVIFGIFMSEIIILHSLEFSSFR